MATLCNSKICTLYVKPESLISSRFVNRKSRGSESSCFEIFDLLLHSWEKHASDLVLVPGSHCATGVILFPLWCTFLVPSVKNTTPTFLEIFLIQYCTVSAQRFMTFMLFLIISKMIEDIPERTIPFFFIKKGNFPHKRKLLLFKGIAFIFYFRSLLRVKKPESCCFWLLWNT